MTTDTVRARTPDGHLDVRRLTRRAANRFYARFNRYFWLPCPTCGQHFGGHEWEHDGRGVPVRPPLFDHTEPRQLAGVCPACADAGVHVTWIVVAPPEAGTWYVTADDLAGPMGHLARAWMRHHQPDEPEVLE